LDGSLYIVATPIGNLKDISFRALQVLREVHLIAAEDTRHTRKLLNHYGIHTPLTSYFEHNKRTKGEYIISVLKQGKSVALVSDAGMPGISDPGEDIVQEAIAGGIRIYPVPGPSASITALVISGLPTGRFVFEGFLPREKKDRRLRLNILSKEPRTMIFYESPFRLTETLRELVKDFGDRRAAVSREITKKFEETKRGMLSELAGFFQDNPPKGEIVLVVEGAPEEKAEVPEDDQLREEVQQLVCTGMPKKEAVKEVARRHRIPKSSVYKLSLKDHKGS